MEISLRNSYQFDQKLTECCDLTSGCATNKLSNLLLPQLIPYFTNWISNISNNLCSEEPEICSQCSSHSTDIFGLMNKPKFQFHQTSFMIDLLCEEEDKYSDCQKFLSSDWLELEYCLTKEDGIFSDLACLYYGNCLGSNQNWTCPEVKDLFVPQLSS